MNKHTPEITVAAAAIMDVMVGNADWRKGLEDSDFLESADWLTACEYASRAISAALPQYERALAALDNLERYASSRRDGVPLSNWGAEAINEARAISILSKGGAA
jgi:hypothetical protein